MKKLTLLLLFLWANNALADDASDSLQAKLNAIRTMSASFNQVINAKTRVISKASGNMALSRPGRFLWQTKKPLEQIVIADGKHLWVYDVELEQVTLKKQDKGLGGTAALFLSGYDNTLTHDFEVTESKVGNELKFDLKAKSSKENFQHMQLAFVGDELTGIELDDQLGQHTTVVLSKIKNNPPLSPTVFKLKIPKGVDLVRQ